EKEELNEELVTVRAKYDSVLAERDVLERERDELSDDLDSLQFSFDEAVRNNEGLTDRLEIIRTQKVAAKKACSERIEELETQLEKLRLAAAPKPSGDNKKDAILNRVREKAKDLDFGIIGYALADDKDDLKRIKGIGPFIETKLHALGIYKFWQIANFTPELEDKINKAIEFFSGRIKRDEWVKQANVLKDEEKDS
ncbi:MAG: hypothetical protein ACPG5B_18015, partial [Chitinophagales bacterium]